MADGQAMGMKPGPVGQEGGGIAHGKRLGGAFIPRAATAFIDTGPSTAKAAIITRISIPRSSDVQSIRFII